MKKCDWPSCLSEKETEQLCNEIYRESIGAEGPKPEPVDYQDRDGCYEIS